MPVQHHYSALFVELLYSVDIGVQLLVFLGIGCCHLRQVYFYQRGCLAGFSIDRIELVRGHPLGGVLTA